jgi:hypothetical protein
MWQQLLANYGNFKDYQGIFKKEMKTHEINY